MLNWVEPFSIFSFLDSNHYSLHTEVDCLLAVDVADAVEINDKDVFNQLFAFVQHRKDWLFGHISYPSELKDPLLFPKAYFFVPKIVIKISKGHLEIFSKEVSPQSIFDAIAAQSDTIKSASKISLQINNGIEQDAYLKKIIQLKSHIQRGDCYEINFCQDFFSTAASIDPLPVYQKLQSLSPNPYAAFYKLNDKFCLCASPERFIKKMGNRLQSQPMKGTIARNSQDAILDAELKMHLATSEKDKSENVMVVDLVRNDLSKICKEGSVKVTELFGIYSFPNVHQMISTIEGEVEESLFWPEILEACFPMGSMTGAPKKRVMELIEQYEKTPRGLFSGTIGYVTPEGNFDFNVVIRSLFYNQSLGLLNFKAGGGITHKSDPVEEYQESMLKVKPIRAMLQQV